MPRNKDWYWECEPALVLADEGLGRIKSPDGWEDEGLSCVGLYWLMLCVMHRSPRRGYLLDENKRPLNGDELAKILRRSPQVVEKVQAVLVSSGLFSLDKHGTVYSRGMVRREELKRKRRKSGRAGGLASRRLLEQMVEQTVEQTGQQKLRVGIGINPTSSSGREKSSEESAIELAQKAAFLSGKGTKPSVVADWHAHISDMLRKGLSSGFIDAELEKSKGVNGDNKSEPPWDFKERLMPSKNKGKGSIADGILSATKWAEEGDKNDAK